MSIGTYRKCPLCGEYGWLDATFNPHRCLPAWECRLEGQDDDEWTIIRGRDAEQAAEKYAEHYDCEGGEYGIVSGNYYEPIVLVRKIGADETPERWAIEAESVPKYRAALVKDKGVAAKPVRP